MHTDSTIAALIPTCGNVATIARVIAGTQAQGLHVIVVDDGSRDGTAQVLADTKGITVCTHTRNRGKAAALLTGFSQTRALGYRHVVALDADGQHYPDDIPLLIAAHHRHPHAVIIGRRTGIDESQRTAGSRFANAFANFWFAVQTLRRVHDTQSGFRLYPLDTVSPCVPRRYEGELALLVLAAWHGYAIHEQPIRVYYPPAAQRVSHFRPAADFARITALNTCLCLLALVYALPLALLRLLRCAARTMVAAVVFTLGSAWLTIAAWRTRHATDRTGAIHQLLHRCGSGIVRVLGLIALPVSVSNPHRETFRRPAVVIANHQSALDIMAVAALSPRLALLTKGWVYHNPCFGYALRHGEYYPITERGIDALMPSLRSLVARGYSIMLFPEGTRSPTARVQRFNYGAFHIARELGLDIVPVLLCAPATVLPKGSYAIRQGRIHIAIGQRITPAQQTALAPIGATLRRRYQQWYDDTADRVL